MKNAFKRVLATGLAATSVLAMTTTAFALDANITSEGGYYTDYTITDAVEEIAATYTIKDTNFYYGQFDVSNVYTATLETVIDLSGEYAFFARPIALQDDGTYALDESIAGTVSGDIGFDSMKQEILDYIATDAFETDFATYIDGMGYTDIDYDAMREEVSASVEENGWFYTFLDFVKGYAPGCYPKENMNFCGMDEGSYIRFNEPGTYLVCAYSGYTDTALDGMYAGLKECYSIIIVENVAVTATATASTVLVDGEEASFEAYNIADNNYFKLRDIAYILDGTDANFELTWNADAGAIEILSDTAYTAVGGEMAAGDGTAKEAYVSTASIYLDGEQIDLKAYTINDNNYFKLRDLGETLGFNVTWDSEAGSIVIASDEEYTAD